MAIDPKAFSPNTQDFAHAAPGFFPHTEDFAHSGTDSLQTPDFARTGQRQLRAMYGGKASLSSLFSGGDDATDAPVATTPTTSPTEPLATPGLGAAEPAGSPSLLSSERVPVVPNFATASPLLTGGQQIGAEIGEAQRGEEGVLGGGSGRQSMSTADRNRALMSFFRPQQAQSQQGTAQTSEPSDTMKAIGSAKSAVGAAGRAKNLLSQKSPGMGFSGGADWSGADWGMPDKFTPGGLTAHEQFGLPATGTPETGDQFGTDPSSAPSASTRDATGTMPDSTNFGLPDFSKLGTYSGLLGLFGSIANTAGNNTGNEDLSHAGQAASAAGQGVKTASDISDLAQGAGSYSGSATGIAALLGTALMKIGQDQKNDGLYQAGRHVNAAASIAGATPLTAPIVAGYMLHPFFKEWDRSRYGQVRNAAETQAGSEVHNLQDLYSQIPAGDIGSMYGALRAKMDSRGAIRSEFNVTPDVAQQLGLPPQSSPYKWDQMSPQQFGAAMDWLSQDPARLDSITGSGDIGYLGVGSANNYAASQRENAKALIARELGLPYIQANYGAGYDAPSPYEHLGEGDIASMTNAEQQYQSERDQFAAKHPGVALRSWTPQYLGLRGAGSPQLNDLMTPPSEMSGVYADPTRKWDQAGGG